MNRVMIIAEIGCNHNGSFDLAKEMIDKAKECGVNGVKLQAFHAEKLISKYAPKAEYQKITTGENDSQLEMTKKLELSEDEIRELTSYAKSIGLICFATPFDLESVEFLNSMDQKLWKIPSGEITNLPYLERISEIVSIDSEKEIILSTGMATIEEIRECLDVLIEDPRVGKEGVKKSRITILHCNTEYPTPDSDVNLSAIEDLKANFPEYKIGLSDHSVGEIAAVTACGMGISMVEKHFTMDKSMPGPDHMASATPEELKILCESVKRACAMIGEGGKRVTESEARNIEIARKSIVALTNISKGEEFSEENITCKRPGNGISPMNWYNVLGKKAIRDFREDELIEI